MIQRKQTLYLLLATIVTFVALMMPVAELSPLTLGVNHVVYNYWVSVSNGVTLQADYSVMPLAILLLLAGTFQVLTIFLYRRRPLQASCCFGIMCLHIIWYVAYVTLMIMKAGEYSADWHFSWAAILPLISLVLVFLARRGVLADEALVRSSERLR